MFHLAVPGTTVNNKASDMNVQSAGGPAFGLFLAVFLTVYAPVLLNSYAFTDDFFDLAAALRGDMSWPITKKITEGRPLLALLTYISLTTAKDIEDLRYLRLVGIVGIAVLAWSVFRLLVRTGWEPVRSFFASVILCTTLPFHVYAAWATTAFYPYAALASGVAFFLGERTFRTHRRSPKWLRVGGASLALLAALAIHQSAAMFLWVFAAVVVLKPDTPLDDVLRRFGWYCMIVMGGLLLGFVVYKLGLALYPALSARTGLVHNIPGKAVWFLLEPLPNALNFSLLSPSHYVFSDFHRIADILLAWGVFVLIVGGMMLYVGGTLKERLWKLGIALSVLPLSYVPNLIVVENWASYRTLPSLTSVVVMYAFFAFHGYLRHCRRLSFTGECCHGKYCTRQCTVGNVSRSYLLRGSTGSRTGDYALAVGPGGSFFSPRNLRDLSYVAGYACTARAVR